MGKLRANSEIISDKSKNPVTTSTYIKHGNQWLDDAVNNAIGAAASKADKTYVDSELTKKANKSDTDAALSSKADKSALEATNASVSANTSNIQELSTESTVLSARMDEFTKLEEGSTTGDAELADGRVGADGKTYDNIGGAIRGQVTNLKSEIDNKSYNHETISGYTLLASSLNAEHGTYASNLDELSPHESQRCVVIRLSDINEKLYFDINTVDSRLKATINVFASRSSMARKSFSWFNKKRGVFLDKSTILRLSPAAQYVEITIYLATGTTLHDWDDNIKFSFFSYDKYGRDVLKDKTASCQSLINNNINIYSPYEDLRLGAGSTFDISNNENYTKFRTIEIDLSDPVLDTNNLKVGTNSNNIIYALTMLTSTSVLETVGWVSVKNGNDIIKKSSIKSLHSNCTWVRLTFLNSPSGNAADRIDWNDNDRVFLYTTENGTEPTSIKIVDVSGSGDYTSLETAVNAEASGTTFIVKPGVYEGNIRAFKKRINIIGTDREKCIIRSTDGRYANPAIECCCGYLENLTVESKYVKGVSNEISTSDTGAYAIHCENQQGNDSLAIGNCLTLHNCKVVSDFFPAIGAGVFKDWSLNIDNCELVSRQTVGRAKYSDADGLGALYFHDMNGEKGAAKVKVKDTIIKSENLKNTVCVYDLQNTGASIECEFINNTIYSASTKFADSVWFRGVESAFGGNFSLSELSHGNTGSVFNK